jgi:hypothetical protein
MDRLYWPARCSSHVAAVFTSYYILFFYQFSREGWMQANSHYRKLLLYRLYETFGIA